MASHQKHVARKMHDSLGQARSCEVSHVLIEQKLAGDVKTSANTKAAETG